MKNDFNNIFFVCSMIEYVSRITQNKRGAVVRALGIEGIRKQLSDAEVNHCLTFDQVAEEWINWYNISDGDFDSVADCKYDVPDYMAIGKLYAYIVTDVQENNTVEETIMNFFSSFLSDLISNFNSDFYCQNPEYLECCYKEGKVLWD